MNGHTNECVGESFRMYYSEHGAVVGSRLETKKERMVIMGEISTTTRGNVNENTCEV